MASALPVLAQQQRQQQIKPIILLNYIQIGRVMLWDACESSYEEHTLDATLKAGRGSFGQVVFATAEGPSGPKMVAVKVPAGSGLEQQLLTIEGNILINIHHDNVVTVHGYMEDPCPNLFAALVLEACDGSLEGLLEPSHVKLSYQQRYLTMDQCFSALAAVHQAGLVHADIKPANTLYCKRGELFDVKLADFGEAMMAGTFMDRQRGTPAYRAPELANPSHAMISDPRSDVFSLGVMMVEFVAPRKISEVFHTPGTLAASHRNGTFVEKMFQCCKVECEPEWLEVAKWCMTYDVQQRPFSQEVLAYLRQQTAGGRACAAHTAPALPPVSLPAFSACSAAAAEFVPRKLTIKKGKKGSGTPPSVKKHVTPVKVPHRQVQCQGWSGERELVMQSASTCGASSPGPVGSPTFRW